MSGNRGGWHWAAERIPGLSNPMHRTLMLCFKGNCFLNAPLHKSHGLMPPPPAAKKHLRDVCREGFVSSDFQSRLQKDRPLPSSVGFALPQLLQSASFLLFQADLLAQGLCHESAVECISYHVLTELRKAGKCPRSSWSSDAPKWQCANFSNSSLTWEITKDFEVP